MEKTNKCDETKLRPTQQSTTITGDILFPFFVYFKFYGAVRTNATIPWKVLFCE